MKHLHFAIAFATAFTINAAIHAESDQKEPAPTPFIEYHNRMAVFNIDHLVYERIETNALYAGIEGWGLRTLNQNRIVAEGEFRMGYNFFWNGRDHWTPLAGIGFFKDFHKTHEHGHHPMKPGIFYGTIGFLYDHEFTDVFNLGLNIKGILGGPVSKKHFDWGSPVGGVDVSLPITFRFGHKRHWDARIEPFNIYLHGSQAAFDYFGFRSTIGYRF
jgi:hypothetical protein